MAGPKCPDCGGMLKSDPVFTLVCQGCSLECIPYECKKCGTIIKWYDPDEGITDPKGFIEHVKVVKIQFKYVLNVMEMNSRNQVTW